jgi:valyl-tRNA synthetase
LCDNYLEIVKGRLYGEDAGAADAARKALYDSLYAVLRLFAPILVHITEELYQGIFREHEGHESIHVAPWPVPGYEDPASLTGGDFCLEIVEAARRFKSERNLSMAAGLGTITVTGPEGAIASMRGFEDDLVNVTRASALEWRIGGEDRVVSIAEPPEPSEEKP